MNTSLWQPTVGSVTVISRLSRLVVYELDQHAAGRSRMQECDLMTPRARAWLGIDQLDTTLPSGRQSALDILSPDSEMVDAGAVAVEIGGNRSLVVGFKQFKQAAIEFEKDDGHTVELLVVHEWGIEQLAVEIGQPGGIVGRNSGVVKLHTGLLTAQRIKRRWVAERHNIPNKISTPGRKPVGMIVTTTDTVPGRKIIRMHGVVRGYTELSTESRERAEKRMEAEAKSMGADAIVGVRFMTGSDTEGAAEVLAYGTAVSLK